MAGEQTATERLVAARLTRAQLRFYEALLEGRVVLEPERPLFEPTTEGQSAAFRIRIDPRP